MIDDPKNINAAVDELNRALSLSMGALMPKMQKKHQLSDAGIHNALAVVHRGSYAAHTVKYFRKPTESLSTLVPKLADACDAAVAEWLIEQAAKAEAGE
jgi:hypothetical protein